MVARAFALGVGGICQRFACLMIAFVVFSNRLHVVISSGDVARCCKVMVLARRVAGGVGHEIFLLVDENNLVAQWSCYCAHVTQLGFEGRDSRSTTG